MAPSDIFTVRVHPFSPMTESCAYEMGVASAENALVFIGGLFNGPHSKTYVRTLARRLEEAAAGALSYSVFEFRLASSFTGFGYSSLAKDVRDITALVKYLRGLGKKRIVLMGHSTGCQVRVHSTWSRRKQE
jgi:pimeloyl-ACP methyl ester carboxylesterase